MKFLQSLAVFFAAASGLWPAMVVTQDERTRGTIIEQNDQFLKLRREDGKELKIPRAKILQIFDDKGDLTWQGTLPPDERPPAPPPEATKPSYANRSVLLDFCIGGVLGGIYAQESQFVDDARIYAQYSDGSNQYAQSTFLALGGAASYQTSDSARWSTLTSYLFRSASQSVYIGDGKDYAKNTLADQVITRRHALLYGKEAHFYPFSEEASVDLIGQIGYELGSYYPFATYSEYRTKLTQVPAAYTGASNVLIHGPTARVGGGFTFRTPRWQFRLLGFYQIMSMFASEQIWASLPKGSIVHDYYASIAIGYGW